MPGKTAHVFTADFFRQTQIEGEEPAFLGLPTVNII